MFDIETTGVDLENDKIVTAAISIVGGDIEEFHNDWTIQTKDIPLESVRIHGISEEEAMKGQIRDEALEQIIGILADEASTGVPLVIFNAVFDLTILDREARRNNIKPLIERVPDFLVVDPYIIDRAAVKSRPGRRNLQTLCRHYRVPFKDSDTHSANEDALAAGRLAWKMGQVFKDLDGMDLKELHARQIKWARVQAKALEEHLNTTGRTEIVPSEWPFQKFEG